MDENVYIKLDGKGTLGTLTKLCSPKFGISAVENLYNPFYNAFEVPICSMRSGIGKYGQFLLDNVVTHYEGLLGGLHKNVLLKGVCGSRSSEFHANQSYPLSDVMPSESPNVVRAQEESSAIRSSLEQLGCLKS